LGGHKTLFSVSGSEVALMADAETQEEESDVELLLSCRCSFDKHGTSSRFKVGL
jgi:hypothetical protein